jgi:phospholipase/carboxylesterase
MPHTQLDQNAPPEMQEALFARAAALPGVVTGPSRVSVPGARAFILPAARGPAMPGGEFAHLHPPRDGSLHMLLPLDLAREAIEAGWAEPHPIAALGGPPNLVMVYGPRDPPELEVVWSLVQAAHSFAVGP